MGKAGSQTLNSDALPAGALTLLFTDIEGSTNLLQDLGHDYETLLTRHHKVLRDTIGEHGGRVVSTHGDSVFAVFRNVSDCVGAAVDAQRLIAKTHWPDDAKLYVRMGFHTGEVRLVENDYIGLDVHRAARICDAGNGGQILLSKSARALLDESELPADVHLRELGAHQLKDLRYPEVLFELRNGVMPGSDRPLRTMAVQPSNLPAPPTSIIGRSHEIERVVSMLQSDGQRLVTLSGPGGCGKSRLALEVASSLLPQFPAGVHYVDFAPVRNEKLVASTIAQSLALTEFPGLPALEAVKLHLGAGRVLLLLDNFETVIAASALVAQLLSACPGLKILVTSREPLNIRSESQFEIAPLGLPDAENGMTVEQLAALDPICLFVSRVRDFDHGFSLTRDNAETVVDICRHLDGLPLAIELAAGQLRDYTLEQLHARLFEQLDRLGRGRRDRETRHRTLQSVFDWSYELLTAREQTLLQAVSVFSGGFGLDGALAVTGGQDAEEELAEMLFALREKSLVKRFVSQGEVRFDMLETVREYALKLLLESPDCEAVRARHASHFTQLVEELAPHMLGRKQRASVSRLLQEAANLRTALEWALEQPSARTTAALTNGLLWFWISQGQFSEAMAWMERALGQAAKADAEIDRARIFDAAGWLHLFAGDHESAAALCQDSLKLFEKVGEPSDVARTKMTSGITMAVTGKIPEGPMMLFEALEMYENLGDDYGTALALVALGEGARAGGDLEGAAQYQTTALGLLRQIYNTYWLGGLLNNLAIYRLKDGDLAQAAQYLLEALEIAEEYDYPIILALCYSVAGAIALDQGDAAAAAHMFGASAGLTGTIGAQLEPNDKAELKRNMDRARKALGESEYSASFDAGATGTPDRMITQAKEICRCV